MKKLKRIWVVNKSVKIKRGYPYLGGVGELIKIMESINWRTKKSLKNPPGFFKTLFNKKQIKAKNPTSTKSTIITYRRHKTQSQLNKNTI